jgi:hypothetical protein
MHWNSLKLLVTNDEKNIFPLKVMCGVNVFFFNFIHFINIHVRLSELTGHLVFAREG